MSSPLKVYTVLEPKSGKIIAAGTAEQCANQMGITVGSFRTFRSRSGRENATYQIDEVEIRETGLDDMIKLWDDSFSWLRDRHRPANPYPCDGCMLRSICEFQDSFCEKWERWYQAAHDAAAEHLKARGGGG